MKRQDTQGKDKASMPVQDERLAILEQQFTASPKEAGAHIRETEENTTILVGVIRNQGWDIKRVCERLETVDQHIEQLRTTLDAYTILLT
jgi:hypothetical protein